MNRYSIYEESKNTYQEVCCDVITTEEFDSEEEFNIFVKMHPSCFYCNRKFDCHKNKITAVFNRYWYRLSNGSNDLSFNSNPNDDNKLREYYKLKSEENELKSRLSKLKQLTLQFE